MSTGYPGSGEPHAIRVAHPTPAQGGRPVTGRLLLTLVVGGLLVVAACSNGSDIEALVTADSAGSTANGDPGTEVATSADGASNLSDPDTLRDPTATDPVVGDDPSEGRPTLPAESPDAPTTDSTGSGQLPRPGSTPETSASAGTSPTTGTDGATPTPAAEGKFPRRTGSFQPFAQTVTGSVDSLGYPFDVNVGYNPNPRTNISRFGAGTFIEGRANDDGPMDVAWLSQCGEIPRKVLISHIEPSGSTYTISRRTEVRVMKTLLGFVKDEKGNSYVFTTPNDWLTKHADIFAG